MQTLATDAGTLQFQGVAVREAERVVAPRPHLPRNGVQIRALVALFDAAPSETGATHRRIQVIVVIVCRFAPCALGAAVLLCMLRVLVVFRRLALHAGRLREGSAGGELQAALLEVQKHVSEGGLGDGFAGTRAILAYLSPDELATLRYCKQIDVLQGGSLAVWHCSVTDLSDASVCSPKTSSTGPSLRPINFIGSAVHAHVINTAAWIHSSSRVQAAMPALTSLQSNMHAQHSDCCADGATPAPTISRRASRRGSRFPKL